MRPQYTYHSVVSQMSLKGLFVVVAVDTIDWYKGYHSFKSHRRSQDMSIAIKLIIVALAAVFPKFKTSYGVFLIILMTFVSLFGFSAAYLDHSFGAASWIVRNEILFGIGASVIGWVVGLTLIRQAKRHEAMMKANLDEYERKKMSKDT